MTTLEPFAAWLLTYALHSTLLLGLAWAVTRWLVQSHSARDLIWKTALVGGLVSSTVQVGAGFEPVAGRFSIAPASEAAGRRDRGTAGVDGAKLEVTNPEAKADYNTESPAVSTSRRPAVSSPSVQPSNRPTVFSQLRTTTLLLGAWAVVALALALQFLAAQFLLVVRVGRRALVRDEQLLELVDLLREEAGIRRHVRLTRAEGLPSPVALGMSEICIPDAALTELDREQQESMLAHELAHLARRDPAWLVAGCLIERVFFFQPLNRLARRGIQESAEYLCDDWAVRRSGSGLTLAKCLVKVAEWIDTTPEPVPVSGMAEMRSHFVARIHRLIANQALSVQPARRWLAPTALGAVAVIVAAAPGVTATRMANETAGRRDGWTAGDPTSSKTAPPIISKVERQMVQRSETHSEMRMDTLTVQPSIRPFVSTADMTASIRIEAIAQGRDTSAVTALIAALKDEDPDVRRAAAQALGNRRDSRAVPALIAVLADKDTEVRAKAIEALSNMKDPRATEGFIVALKDENPEVRAKAAEALGNLPETRRGYTVDAQRASAALAALLGDISAEVRRSAIQALREVKGARPTDALISALKDADAEVRQSAAEALGDIEARNAMQQLIVLLNDPNADVRHAAAHALGHLKDPQAAEALARALKDSNNEVRQAAAESLGDLDLAQAPQGLLDAMRDENADVRHAAVDAIGNIRDPRAVPILATLTDDPDGDVREAAVDALSEIRGAGGAQSSGDPAAIQALVKAMKSRDPNVRRRAAEALGEKF